MSNFSKHVNDWVSVELTDVFTSAKRGPFGSAIKKEFFVTEGYKVYEQQNAIYDDYTRGKYFIDEKKFKELESFEVRPGDYIVSCSGTIGKISRLHHDAPIGVINQALLKFGLNDELINHKWFAHLFRSGFFQEKIIKEVRGSAMKNIAGLKEIKKIGLEIPSLNEQNKIAEVIEDLLSDLGNAVDNFKKAKEQLKIYRQSVLQDAFSGKLIDNHQKFEEVELSSVCEDVQNINKDYKIDSTFFYIDIGCIDNGQNRIVRHKEYSWENAPSRAKQIIKTDDILFSTVRTYLKNIALVPVEYNAQIGSTGFCVIRPKKDLLNSRYLFLYVLLETFTNKVSTFQTGSSYPAVRDEDIFSQSIPLPVLETQIKVVDEVEARFSICDKIEETINDGLKQAEVLRQSILKKAFEGKLTEKWRAEYPELITGKNSAKALLEKIKSTNKETNTKKERVQTL